MEALALSPCNFSTFLLFYTNISSQYFLQSDLLDVSFDTSAFCYVNFTLELWRTEKGEEYCDGMNGEKVTERTVYATIPTTTTRINGPFITGFYCIRVAPVKVSEGGTCRSGCKTVCSQIFINSTVRKPFFRPRGLVQGKLIKRGTDPKGDRLNCKNWNASVKLQPDIASASLVLYVSVIEPYSLCFTYLNICLWVDAVDECNSLSGKEVAQQVLNGSNGTVTFEHLLPGNYCIRMKASHPTCGKFGCMPLYSNIQPLYAPEPPFKEQTITQANFGPPWFYALLVVVAAVVVISVVGFIRYKKKLHFPPNVSSLSYLELHEVLELAEKAILGREVVLLYSPEFLEHSDLVFCLYHFLHEGCGFPQVRIDVNEEHNIGINLHGWTARMMQPHPQKRILIVESEGVVLQEEGRMMSKVVRRDDKVWDCLDPVLPSALEMLRDRSPYDYGNILVARFPYTAPELRLKCFVPHHRFFLPEHLFELYEALLGIPKTRIISSDVRQAWMKIVTDHWQILRSFNDLQKAILMAHKKWQENPDLVRDTFIEEPLIKV